MKHKSIMLLVIGLMVSIHTLGQEKLRVGFLPFPPFAMAVDEDKVTGIAVERVASILKQLKVDYEIQIYPPKRLHLLMATANLDFMLGTKTNKIFQQHVHFSQKPYTDLKLVIYTLMTRDLPETLDQLEGVIGMPRGYRLPPSVNKDKVTLYPVNVHEQLFLMLTALPKRLDYVIDYETPAKMALKNTNIVPSRLKTRVLSNTPLYFCIRKDYPGSEELLSRIEEVNESFQGN